MIDLEKEQHIAFFNYMNRGYEISNESMIEHYKDEIKELETAPKLKDRGVLVRLANIRDRKKLLKAHRLFMKNTDADELADLVISALTIATSRGIDIERAVMIKQKVNEFRTD